MSSSGDAADALGRFGRLVAIRRSGVDGPKMAIEDRDSISVGSDPDCTVRIMIPTVKPLHAELCFDSDGRLWLHRRQGEVGTVVLNDEVVRDALLLRDGAVFLIADRKFRYENPMAPRTPARVLPAAAQRPPEGRRSTFSAGAVSTPLRTALEERRRATDPRGLPNTPSDYRAPARPAVRCTAPPAPPAPVLPLVDLGFGARPVLPAELAEQIRRRRKSVLAAATLTPARAPSAAAGGPARTPGKAHATPAGKPRTPRAPSSVSVAAAAAAAAAAAVAAAVSPIAAAPLPPAVDVPGADAATTPLTPLPMNTATPSKRASAKKLRAEKEKERRTGENLPTGGGDARADFFDELRAAVDRRAKSKVVAKTPKRVKFDPQPDLRSEMHKELLRAVGRTLIAKYYRVLPSPQAPTPAAAAVTAATDMDVAPMPECLSAFEPVPDHTDAPAAAPASVAVDPSPRSVVLQYYRVLPASPAA